MFFVLLFSELIPTGFVLLWLNLEMVPKIHPDDDPQDESVDDESSISAVGTLSELQFSNNAPWSI